MGKIKRGVLISCITMVFICGRILAEDNMIKKYELEKTNYLEKEKKKRAVLGDLYKIKTEMKQIDRDKAVLLSKFDHTENKFNTLSDQLKEVQEKTKLQKRELRRQLDFIVKFQDTGLLKIIFSSQTPIELDRNLKLLRTLTEHDFITIKSYIKNMKLISLKRDEASSEELKLSKIKKEILGKENLLLYNQKKKSELLKNLDASGNLSLIQIQKLREKSYQAKMFVDTILKPLVFEEKGKLNLPVNGEIIQKYGYMLDPIYKTRLRHKGIFLKSEPYTPVNSIYSGVIEFVGSVPGFGNTIIISHGDNYFSVYCYLQSTNVKVGDHIKQNQSIAKTGGNHPYFGNGLYFEMRYFSEPINPAEWFKHAKIKGSSDAVL